MVSIEQPKGDGHGGGRFVEDERGQELPCKIFIGKGSLGGAHRIRVGEPWREEGEEANVLGKGDYLIVEPQLNANWLIIEEGWVDVPFGKLLKFGLLSIVFQTDFVRPGRG